MTPNRRSTPNRGATISSEPCLFILTPPLSAEHISLPLRPEKRLATQLTRRSVLPPASDTTLEDCSDDVLRAIAEFLPTASDVMRLACCSNRLRGICSQNSIWMPLVRRRWPNLPTTLLVELAATPPELKAFYLHLRDRRFEDIQLLTHDGPLDSFHQQLALSRSSEFEELVPGCRKR